MMTVDEILACKIPEGKYKRALHIMISSILGRQSKSWQHDEFNSFRAAFSALYELAQGKAVCNSAKCVLETDVISAIRSGTIKEVLAVVDEMDYQRPVIYCEITIAEFRKRIAALGGGGK
jgi:hypothetical protein